MRIRLVLLFSAILAGTFQIKAQTQVGALRHGANFDLSVLFANPPEVTSALALESYNLTPGALIASRLTATNHGVILTAQDLAANSPATLVIDGVVDSAGQPLPLEIITFNTGHLLWATIGGAELGFPADATSYRTNAFDLISGGIQQREDYDEATFVGEAITGNFERFVRVLSVDPSGFEAKASLMVRESLDEGKPRPLDPENIEQGFSRYAAVAINAGVTAFGEPTGLGHTVYRRAVTASQLTESFNDPVAPEFPNAWLRVVRSGQTFSFYRGTNGVDWIHVRDESFPAAFPDTAYVGVSFTPQNDDLPPSGGVRKSFVAKFRDYNTLSIVGELAINLVGDHAELSWTGSGTLESAPTVTGDWTAAPSQQNPQNIPLTGATRFFRLH